MDSTTTLSVEIPLRIDWSEMDLFGHVNNVAFFKYIQASRVNYWEQSGISKLFAETKIGPILASVNCSFIQPLFYPGNILIKAQIEFMKTTSFGLHHQIFNDKQELAAESHDVMVFYDFNTNQKMQIPINIKAEIEKLERTIL